VTLVVLPVLIMYTLWIVCWTL